ncbi:hypothetical protein DSO57_1036773 [Entomophthora muscae]|uniref:Uncharacterized protein n=1 Tax=Entomophthora muscae TaxID=34485 RepID=A0ACC2RDZ4_9FUNG|nr:hypothetical protein DSO57_1036773 [Entomophthora muscae]
MQDELDKVPAARVSVNPPPSHSEEGGCYPGLEGRPRIFCAVAMNNLAQEVRELVKSHDELENNLHVRSCPYWCKFIN